ncbi:MAG: DUF4838 domain-containing protein, partial [Ruminococcaceae bacterium]|nr:DUF4838 domain-containing protein [Oscillospiraceae bacterium]
TGSSFKDVKPTAWYASAVEWANQKGITTGVGGGKFAPDTLISREQLATMLRRYAEYKGMDIIVENASFEGFADADKVSEWAKQGVEWAVEKGVIKGADVKGTLYLNPQNNAARSECAQMLSNFLYIEPRYEINGNDISLYKIVYNENAKGSEATPRESAEFLAEAIKLSLGLELPIVADTEAVSDYEILVGWTNREELGLVTVNRDSFADDSYFTWSVQGDYLVIAGIDSDAESSPVTDRSAVNMNGTENALFQFVGDVLGVEYYTNENIVATPDPVISLIDGYCVTDNVDFKWRTLDIDGYVSRTENYYEEWGCGLPHQVGNLMNGNWKKGIYENTWANPCFTSEENVNALIQNVGELLETKPKLNLVGLIQNDSHSYCRCNSCMAVYREYKSRSAALLSLINKVCEYYEEKYPNVLYATWNYTWAADPPVNMELHKNILMYYNTLILCPAHDYGDPDCEYNSEFITLIETWNSLTSHNMFLWEHSNASDAPLTPFPNLDNMRNNIELFASYGVNGVFLNAANGGGWDFSDFNLMRGYLFNQLFRNAYMSEEEYDYRINSFLEANYGSGWRSLRKYLDRISDISDTKCHPLHSPTSGYYDFEEVRSVMDEMDRYWEQAKIGATDEQIERIEHEELSWFYLKQCALYETQYTNGNEESKAIYIENNEKLYEMMEKHGHYSLKNGHHPYNNPENWW